MSGWRRAGGWLAVMVLAGAGLSGCAGGKQSLDCGKEAIRLAGDLQDVTDRATNVGNLVDPVRRKETSDAIGKLEKDAGAMASGSSDPARRKAVREITAASATARESVEAGRTPDLSKLAGAVGDWSKTCGLH